MPRLLLLLLGLTIGARAHALITIPSAVANQLAGATLVADIVVDSTVTTPDKRFGLLSRASARLERIERWQGEQRAEPRSGDAITIVSPGGENGGIGVAITGMPRPLKGRRYHAHLRQTKTGDYEVTGFDSGLVPTDGSRIWSRNRTDGSNGDGTGPFLFWPREAFPIPYYIAVSTFLGHPDFVAAIDRSFRTWRNVPDTQFDFINMGCTSVVANDNDGINAVIFISHNWPYDPAAIAITRNFYVAGDSGRAGVVLDSDILINGDQWDFTTTGEPGKHDVQNIVTHEAGHFLGLGHERAPPSPSGNPAAVMYATASPGELNKRTLSSDDLTAIQAAYPGGGNKAPTFPLGTSCLIPSGLKGCAAVHGTPFPGPLPALIALLWLVGVIVAGRISERCWWRAPARR